MSALGKNPASPCILHALGYLALALLLGGGVVGLTLEGCEGELIPPLDDTFIYLQYARSAARGEPLEYQPGMGYTRGATSILQPLLLAPWARILPPRLLAWAAVALGSLFLAGTAWAADRWATRVLGPGAAWAAGLLTLASGHLLWGCLSGMEIGIYAFLITASLAAVAWYQEATEAQTGVRRLALLWVLLFLIPLARPEGVLLAGVVALGLPYLCEAPNSPRARAILILAPLAAGAITAGLNLLATGDLGSNTLASKAVWGEPRPDIQDGIYRNLPGVFIHLARMLFSDYGSPAFGFGTGYVLWALMMGGAVLGAVLGRRRGSVRLLVVATGVALLAGLIPLGYRSHYYRYQMPYVPLAVLLVTYGWWRFLTPRWPKLRPVVFVLIGLLLLPGLWRFGHRYAENASNIRDHQVTMGRWIDENLPSDARIAINDAGALAYFGNRPVVDLVGLVTNGTAVPYRSGQGSLFEWLEEMPVSDRPTHFAVFPLWFPYLERTSLIGGKLLQLTLANNTISGADIKSVYEADWSRVEAEDAPIIRSELLSLWGFTVSDALDVGDLASQHDHDYVAFDTWRDTLREYAVKDHPQAVLIDGGRLPTRGERFRMRCVPQAPGALIMRTESYAEFRLRVHVNGQEAGVWEIQRDPVIWTEPLFEIPGDLFTGDTAEIELTLVDAKRPYPSFHYWLIQ